MTSRGVRVLDRADVADFLVLTQRDPVVNVFAEYRARTTNLEPRWLGGKVLGLRDLDGTLGAAMHVGANLVPVSCSPEAARVFGRWLRRQPSQVSTIFGREPVVRAFWDEVAPTWLSPREERWVQPHLELAADPLVAPDPLVRRSVPEDFDQLYPACVAMYTEEVGVSPELQGTRELYRARVRQLISRGWSFARYEDGRLVFKAEIGSVSTHAAQIQGVYVPEDLRGRGLATAGMAAVARLVRRDIAPVVSLYVNDWNIGARRAYERVGFRQTATFATVMF
ncbi:MAG: GNAT family N-acetyltransferase [Nocardioides sp.]|jgi:predicted GNAT family acetyltransferase